MTFFFLLLLFLITDHFIGLVNRLLDITPLPFLCYLSPFHIYSVNLVGSLTVSSQWKMVGFAFWSWLRDTRDSGVKSTDGLASIYWQTYSLSIATVSASVQKHNIKVLFCYFILFFTCCGRRLLLNSVNKGRDQSAVQLAPHNLVDLPFFIFPFSQLFPFPFSFFLHLLHIWRICPPYLYPQMHRRYWSAQHGRNVFRVVFSQAWCFLTILDVAPWVRRKKYLEQGLHIPLGLIVFFFWSWWTGSIHHFLLVCSFLVTWKRLIYLWKYYCVQSWRVRSSAQLSQSCEGDG